MRYARAVKKSNGSIDVAGKTFAFESGTESELEAYTAAAAYLDEKHRERISEIAPKPGSRRLLPRDYDTAPTAATATGEVLTPAPAKLKKRGK